MPSTPELLRTCQQALATHDRRALFEAASAALAQVETGDDFDLVRIGIAARDIGLTKLADGIFHALIEHRPGSQFAYYEAAISSLLSGDHRAGITQLRAALRRWPGERRASCLLARLLFLVRAFDEGHAILSGLTKAGEDDEVRELRALGTYLEAVPRESVHAQHRDLNTVSTAAVALRLRAAKDERTGFALVRLGDGEGAFVRLGLDDERRYASLYERNRREFSQNWFGPAFDLNASGFLKLSHELPALVAEADVIGVPHPEWIDLEYRIGSPRGVPSLGNVFQMLEEHRAFRRSRAVFCRQLIHLDLARSGVLHGLLAGEREVGLVSCYADLPDWLKARFGVGSVEFHKLPGAQNVRGLIEEEAAVGEHFPAVFADVMRALSRPHKGKIFLLAGGFLAKFYAIQIRRYGGIAIDIGSLADIWMARATRPGYRELIAEGAH